MVETLTFKTIVEAICEEVYAYHEKEYAIDRLVPPWEKTEVLHKPAGLAVGGVIHIQKMHQDWLVEHIECNKQDYPCLVF